MWRACLPALIILFAARASWGNAGPPITYYVEVDGNNVTVCLHNYENRSCPDTGLLRQGLDGKIVSLTDCDADQCFVDTCVPPGRYQYGLAVPYKCSSSAQRTDYYSEATVESPLPARCTRPVSHRGPQPASTVPWEDSGEICSYQGPPPRPEQPGAPGAATESAAGCNLGAGGVGAEAVLAINLVAFVVGRRLLRRRRR